MPEAGVTIKGANETALYLRNFHRDDIFQVLEEEVRGILSKTAAAAKGRYPDGSWVTSLGRGGSRWPAGEVSTAGGSSRKKQSWADASAGVKASIFDTMGRRSGGKTPQARATIASLTSRYGTPQRFLWPAWMENRAESMREIEKAFERAEDRLQAKLNGA